MPAKIIFFLLISFIFSVPFANAQETPPSNPQNTQVLNAKGAPFGEGWNYFKLGFDKCSAKNVLDELQADGGGALKVSNLYVKELFDWKSYSAISEKSKDKKLAKNDLLAFYANQKFFFEMDQKTCISPDAKRQAQIDIVREGVSGKTPIIEKVRDLPSDLWTKLVELLNTDTSPSSSPQTSGKQALENVTIGGKTVVKDLGITGKITSGLLIIEGLSDLGTTTINTLSNDLYIQNEGIGGINFLGGLVTIDKNGNLKVQKLSIDTSESSSSSIGSATLKGGSTFQDITTTSVTQNSKIFVTPTSETGGQALIVKSKTTGKGFRVIIEKSYTSDTTFDWWVIN